MIINGDIGQHATTKGKNGTYLFTRKRYNWYSNIDWYKRSHLSALKYSSYMEKLKKS